MSDSEKIGFILYDSRSGSTLLSALLNQFRGVDVSQESGFIPIIMEFPEVVSDESMLNKLFDRLYGEIQFQELGLDRMALKQSLEQIEYPLDKKSIIDTILNFYFSIRQANNSFWLIKSPRMFYHAKNVLKLYPNAKFIHLIRDGRAVYNSKRTMRSVYGRLAQNNLLKAAHDWKKRINMARRLKRNIIEIKYEDLVEQQGMIMQKVLDFLNIPEEGRNITKDQSQYAEIIGGKQKHLHKNVNSAPKKEIINKWKAELSREDILLYEVFTKSYLIDMGYICKELGSPPDYGLYIKSAARCLYFIIHQLYLYARNIFWHLFVDHSFIRKCREKIIEFSS